MQGRVQYGNVLAAGTSTGDIWVYQAATEKLLSICSGHSDGVWSVAFGAGGNTLASSSDDQMVHLWDSRSGQCLKTLRDHTNRVRAVAFSPDGSLLVSGGDDQKVRLWASDSSECLKVLEGHTDHIWSVTFTPTGTCWQQVALTIPSVCGMYTQVKVSKYYKDIPMRYDHWHSVLMEGTGLYSAAQRRKMDWIVVKAICDWADGNKQYDEEHHQKLAAENAVRFTLHVLQQGGFVEESVRSPSSSGIAGQVPPPALGTTLCTYNGHTSYVVAVAWEPQGSCIASAGGDGTVQVWDAETGHTLQTYRGHPWRFAKVNWPPTIHRVAWSPEGLRLASAGDGINVFVWNATTGQTLALYSGHVGLLADVFDLAWSPDGKYIASACSCAGLDKTVHVWNAATAETVKRLNAGYGLFYPQFSVSTLAWSPDGSRIAAACGDKIIRIWNAMTGQLISSYQTRSEWVYQLA